jgi:TRAP-type C4-dicarboxylate transport system permease small subunit
MKQLDRAIDILIRVVMGISAFVLSATTILQVITRYFFKNPIGWGQDIVRLSFVYIVFWGGAYCIKNNEHLNIDVVLTALKPKTKKLVEILISIILICFFVFISYYGYLFMQTGTTQKSPYLLIPMSIYYISLPTAGLIMVYYQVLLLLKQIKELREYGTGGGTQ